MLTRLIICLTTLHLYTPVIAYQDCHRASLLNNQALDLPDERQHYPQQKRILNQAIQLCPKHPQAHNNLAHIFEQEQNYTQAIEHYRRAIQAQPKYSNAWYGLGEVYYKQGRFPLSLEAHLHACQNDPDSKARVIAFLKTNRYAVTEEGEIIDRESLLVLYARRQNLERMITECGLKASPIMQKHIFRNFQFDTGKASLQSGSERQLKEIAAALRNLYNRVVHIHGHTDTQQFKKVSVAESERLNWKLSQDRATTVAHALDELGVSITRIKIHAHGYREPLVSGENPAAWAQNRRVEIEVD